MSQQLVRHAFFDPTEKKIYHLLMAPKVQCLIKRDKDMASQMFVHAKTIDNKELEANIVLDVCTEIGGDDRGSFNDADAGPSTPMTNKTDENMNGPEILGKENKSYNWQYDDTRALISSYGSHLDELHHPVHRKYFWANVVNDLISQKFNVTEKLCHSKWNNLNRSYKQCKDKTGRPQSRFLFFDEMDDILGTKPSNSSHFALSSLKTKPLHENENQVRKEEQKATKEDLKKKKDNCEKPAKKVKLSEKKFDYKEKKLELLRKKIELEERKLLIEQKKIKADEEKRELIKAYLQKK